MNANLDPASSLTTFTVNPFEEVQAMINPFACTKQEIILFKCEDHYNYTKSNSDSQKKKKHQHVKVFEFLKQSLYLVILFYSQENTVM